MTDHEQSSFSRDAARLAGCLAIVFLIAWAPFALGLATLLSSASDVPSLFPNGARAAFDPGAKVLKSLDEGAPGWQSEPWFEISHEIEFGEGKLPFWDPYEGYGTPFAAAMQPQPFYPLAFLLSIAPNPYTYNLYVLARLFLFAFGCALFVRMFAGFPAALTAGMCAAFSGYFIVYYDMPHLSVEIMMPWTLVAAELVARKPGLRTAAALAVALLLTILGVCRSQPRLRGYFSCATPPCAPPHYGTTGRRYRALRVSGRGSPLRAPQARPCWAPSSS